MRFHKSESAFFVFMALILGSGALVLYAYGVLYAATGNLHMPGSLDDLSSVSRLLFASGVLISTALFFGVFLIYPLIRTQAREEVKLREMTETLSARSETLEHAALTDGLTGMQNRRYFDDALREYLTEFRRIQKPIGLMVLDLDHFKQVNDTHGHDVGDEVLRSVASTLRDMTRYHDVVARLGGEEFAVVAPNMSEDQLFKLAERIRKAIAAGTVQAGGAKLRITTSVGLAVWDGKETGEDFYRRADKQLYQAKRQGRNRVCA
jgi:two-component system cell cycle response regulator